MVLDTYLKKKNVLKPFKHVLMSRTQILPFREQRGPDAHWQHHGNQSRCQVVQCIATKCPAQRA